MATPTQMAEAVAFFQPGCDHGNHQTVVILFLASIVAGRTIAGTATAGVVAGGVCAKGANSGPAAIAAFYF